MTTVTLHNYIHLKQSMRIESTWTVQIRTIVIKFVCDKLETKYINNKRCK